MMGGAVGGFNATGLTGRKVQDECGRTAFHEFHGSSKPQYDPDEGGIPDEPVPFMQYLP